MEAVFKSILVRKFDTAIKDAKDARCYIVCFKLSSLEENTMFQRHINLTGKYSETETYDYEGIPIQEFIKEKANETN